MTERLHRVAPLALAGSVVLSAGGQLCMKAGMLELNRALAAHSGLFAMHGAVIWTASGLLSYAVSLCLWLIVLVRYPLSVAYPLLGLSYVCVYAGATFWPRLAETASVSRSLGTLAILVGVALVYFNQSRTRTAGEDQATEKPTSPPD